jgi:hypothetical protein
MLSISSTLWFRERSPSAVAGSDVVPSRGAVAAAGPCCRVLWIEPKGTINSLCRVLPVASLLQDEVGHRGLDTCGQLHSERVIAGYFAARTSSRTNASGRQTTSPSKPHKAGPIDEPPLRKNWPNIPVVAAPTCALNGHSCRTSRCLSWPQGRCEGNAKPRIAREHHPC